MRIRDFRITGLRKGARLVLWHQPERFDALAYGTVTTVDKDDFTYRVDNQDVLSNSTLRQHMGCASGDICRVEPATRLRENERLLVMFGDGGLRDAKVVSPPNGTADGSSHRVSFADKREAPVDLNPFNHCNEDATLSAALGGAAVGGVKRGAAAWLDAATFEAQRGDYCRNLVKHASTVTDAITDVELSIEHHLVHIGLRKDSGVRRADLDGLRDARDLARWLVHGLEEDRGRGTLEAPPVLVRADAGTGKSWLIKQLQYLIAAEVGSTTVRTGGDTTAAKLPLAPYTIIINRLVALLPSTEPPHDESLIESYIRRYAAPTTVPMLVMALKMRALVLLVDGLDEAAGRKEVLEKYLVRTLVPMGFRIVATSRPSGVRLRLFSEYASRFVVLDLAKLEPTQQLECAKHQLREHESQWLAFEKRFRSAEGGFMREVVETPVLLSLLILVFREQAEHPTHTPLPSSLLELYRAGLSASLGFQTADKRALAWSMLRRVAMHLMTVGAGEQSAKASRLFTFADGEAALEGYQRELELWRSQAASHFDKVRVLKTLSTEHVGGEATRAVELQFSHLTIQEALVADVLVREDVLDLQALGRTRRGLFGWTAAVAWDRVSWRDLLSKVHVLRDWGGVFHIGGKTLRRTVCAMAHPWTFVIALGRLLRSTALELDGVLRKISGMWDYNSGVTASGATAALCHGRQPCAWNARR